MHRQWLGQLKKPPDSPQRKMPTVEAARRGQEMHPALYNGGDDVRMGRESCLNTSRLNPNGKCANVG